MNCEHAFRPMPDSRRVIYCERCGEFRELDRKVVKGPTPKAPRAPRRREPTNVELPFGVPVAIGKQSPIEGDGRPATPAELAELELRFGGANPVTQAAAINEMAERVGTRRPPDGDPPGTYRPGETEVPPWLAPLPQQ